MSFLKRFNFFPKFTVDNISKPTLLGSILSLSAMSIMFFLMYEQFHEYVNPTIVKETIILHDQDQNTKIALNLQMLFLHMPCDILSVDQEDDLGNHYKDIHSTLIKHRFTKNHTVVIEDDELKPEEIINEVEGDEQCQLSGHIDIQKVPGNIHISNHAFRHEWENLKVVEAKVFPRMTLSHETEILNFGNYSTIHHILRRFGISEHTEFNRGKKLPKFITNTKKNFDYFLKIIPYQFVDEERDDTTVGYQYSLNFRERPFIDDNHKMHIVKINYSFSPVAMRITRKKKYISHFLGHVCAIIGGIFVIFGLINKLFFACCEVDKKL